MRQERTVQASIFDVFAGHEIGRELKADLGVAGWASRAGQPGGGGSAPRGGAGDRTARPAGGDGAALCAAQAVPAAELRGAGLSSGGLGVVSGLCPLALAVDPEEIGAAADDQRDPRRDLGGDQSGAAFKRPPGEARGRQRGAAGQHGDRGADPRTERQQPVVGRRAGDGPPAQGGGSLAWRRRAPLARSSPRGEETRASDRVHPRPAQTGASSIAS